MLKIPFLSLWISNFSGGGCPQTPQTNSRLPRVWKPRPHFDRGSAVPAFGSQISSSMQICDELNLPFFLIQFDFTFVNFLQSSFPLTSELLLHYSDERRLRKLKVYLKSVSYNGCEGMKLPNLNDLYCDQLLLDEFPCTELAKNEEFKCNPTPFVIASCFNRTQVTDKTNSKGNRGSRRAPRNQNGAPRKRNLQKPNSTVTTKPQSSPVKTCAPLMLQQKTIRTEITNPMNKTLNGKVDKLEHVKPKEEKAPEKAPVQEEKRAITQNKGKTI